MAVVADARMVFDFNEQGRLVEDLPCLECGYSLRGCSVLGDCPECGTRIGRSRNGSLLRLAHPGWRETLNSGVFWLKTGIIIAICAAVLFVGLQIAFGGGRVLNLGAVMPLCLGAILAFHGSDKITRPEPGAVEAGVSYRSLARFGYRASSLVAILFFFAPSQLPVYRLLRVFTLDVLYPAWVIALLIYLCGVAKRVPDGRLARRTRVYAIVFAGWSVLGLVFALGMEVLHTVLGSRAASGASSTAAVAQVVVVLVAPSLVIYGGLAWLLQGYRRALAGVLGTVVAHRTAHLRRQGYSITLPQEFDHADAR